ncbi:S8 family serine peptidase [Microbacterium sp.]|uniref:S8 family serine peptidase n=1 Tax=Microbacterium sp. TaxID=51671 RepID=UPI0039E27B0F
MSQWYVLDERADDYGWPVLDESPPATTVGTVGGEETSTLSLPVAQAAPNTLRRVNAFLRGARLSLTPRGVVGGTAFLDVERAVDGAPDPGHEAPVTASAVLDLLADAVADEVGATTAAAVSTFLGQSHDLLGQNPDRAPGHSTTEVLSSVKSTFGARRLFSVKSTFSETGRSTVQLPLGAPPLPAPPDDPAEVWVAVLDTGIGRHPWLPEDAWVDARSRGWVPDGDVPAPADENASPHDGHIDAFAGHGTFVAGLIRQLAPSAGILSFHTMGGDGAQPGESVLSGLRWICAQLTAQKLSVDVVCLACGYYEAAPSEDDHLTALRQVLGELGELGVQVVAAAGNDATAAPAFPAALRGLAVDGLPRTPLLAAGALNPDGSRADFSNHGTWVTDWAPGVALLSSVPESFGRPGFADVAAPLDPDNLVGGFARWSGTSFAAAYLTGLIADAIARGPHLEDRPARVSEALQRLKGSR